MVNVIVIVVEKVNANLSQYYVVFTIMQSILSYRQRRHLCRRWCPSVGITPKVLDGFWTNLQSQSILGQIRN